MEYPILTEDQLVSRDDPLPQLQLWVENDPDMIMTLSTVGSTGNPSCRILSGVIHNSSIQFYTDSTSRKGRDFTANPNVAVVLFFVKDCRQVRVEGTVKQLPKECATKQFHNLPRECQITLLASAQDKPIDSRAALVEKRDEVAKKYSDTSSIPVPPHFDGYCVTPNVIEFYQGQTDFLADRLLFTRQPDDSWALQRIMP